MLSHHACLTHLASSLHLTSPSDAFSLSLLVPVITAFQAWNSQVLVSRRLKKLFSKYWYFCYFMKLKSLVLGFHVENLIFSLINISSDVGIVIFHFESNRILDYYSKFRIESNSFCRSQKYVKFVFLNANFSC